MADSDKYGSPRLTKNQRVVPAPPERILEDSTSSDYVAQIGLAGVLRHPQGALFKQILDQCADRGHEFQIEALQRARALIEHTIGTSLRSGKHNEGAPILIDRLSFAWRLMQQADTTLWKLKKSDLPTPTTLAFAHTIFAPLLPGGVRMPLVEALMEMLRAGEDGRFLLAYFLFKRAKAPNPDELVPPLSAAVRTGNKENIRRVIWWCVRARREKYVDVPANEPVRIEFAYLVEAVLEDLAGWFGTDQPIDTLAPDVEAEVNQWLTYSCLQESVESGSPTGDIDRDIARAFLKHNELKTKLKIWSRPVTPTGREAELENQLRQYVAENQALEERLKATLVAQPPSGVEPSIEAADVSRLREVLKAIDAKYAFDTLNAVQLGDETHLTLRSFVSHLFYSLRKQGLTEYPDLTEFNLTYDESGLYDCDGFEVPPGESVPVKVMRKGWAIKSKGRLSPVRRAQVAKASRA